MIDFKTPVLAKLKELAENPEHPTLLVTNEQTWSKGRACIEYTIRGKSPVGESTELLLLNDIWKDWFSDWANAAFLLGIFDEIISAAVDATVPTPQQPQA